MARYRHIPSEIDAIQFDGTNWIDMATFVGTRKTSDGFEVPAFNPIGTFIISFFPRPDRENARAELWVEANARNVYIEIGEWIIKDEKGFYPCKDDMFKKLYEEVA